MSYKNPTQRTMSLILLAIANGRNTVDEANHYAGASTDYELDALVSKGLVEVRLDDMLTITPKGVDWASDFRKWDAEVSKPVVCHFVAQAARSIPFDDEVRRRLHVRSIFDFLEGSDVANGVEGVSPDHYRDIVGDVSSNTLRNAIFDAKGIR